MPSARADAAYAAFFIGDRFAAVDLLAERMSATSFCRWPRIDEDADDHRKDPVESDFLAGLIVRAAALLDKGSPWGASG
ncbi:hypothetical protein GCM10010341_17960 [Streptomyces noursei]|nr:hypothetical protein GCM10010341_17960 [Streptomyces noursei]